MNEAGATMEVVARPCGVGVARRPSRHVRVGLRPRPVLLPRAPGGDPGLHHAADDDPRQGPRGVAQVLLRGAGV